MAERSKGAFTRTDFHAENPWRKIRDEQSACVNKQSAYMRRIKFYRSGILNPFHDSIWETLATGSFCVPWRGLLVSIIKHQSIPPIRTPNFDDAALLPVNRSSAGEDVLTQKMLFPFASTFFLQFSASCNRSSVIMLLYAPFANLFASQAFTHYVLFALLMFLALFLTYT